MNDNDLSKTAKQMFEKYRLEFCQKGMWISEKKHWLFMGKKGFEKRKPFKLSFSFCNFLNYSLTANQWLNKLNKI